MVPISSRITFLTADFETLEKVKEVPVHAMWDARVCDFLAELSRKLLKDKRSRQYEDVVSYAYWIRKASLEHIQEVYYPQAKDKVGRGVALHIAPSNVPINFAVSFTSALLAGNCCVVRVSNKQFEQVDIVTDAINELFANGFEDMKPYLILVRYEHDAEVTQFLSDMCDVRIIWGGNRTIHLIRQAELPPRAIEMAFADRHSLSLINANEVNERDQIDDLVEGFYTDTYYSDQNACSSPRIVIWMGEKEEIAKAKDRFWTALHKKVVDQYDLKPVHIIDKWDMFCQIAAKSQDVHLESGNDGWIMRVRVDKLTGDLMDYKLGGGYFYEYDAANLEELYPILGKSCQTIGVFGIEQDTVLEAVRKMGVRGVDRIVPIGKTMDLTFKWDGYDMIENMSRYIYCPKYIK